MQPDVVFIAVTLSDDSLAVMQFITNDYRGIQREATPEAIKNEISRTAWTSPVIRWKIVDKKHLPQDRAFRNAWRERGGKIEHDMNHVRTIHLDRLREERKGILDQKDREWERAFGQGKIAEASRVEAQRQALRDMPVTLEKDFKKAKTVEDIKKISLPV